MSGFFSGGGGRLRGSEDSVEEEAGPELGGTFCVEAFN